VIESWCYYWTEKKQVTTELGTEGSDLRRESGCVGVGADRLFDLICWRLKSCTRWSRNVREKTGTKEQKPERMELEQKKRPKTFKGHRIDSTHLKQKKRESPNYLGEKGSGRAGNPSAPQLCHPMFHQGPRPIKWTDRNGESHRNSRHPPVGEGRKEFIKKNAIMKKLLKEKKGKLRWK